MTTTGSEGMPKQMAQILDGPLRGKLKTWLEVADTDRPWGKRATPPQMASNRMIEERGFGVLQELGAELVWRVHRSQRFKTSPVFAILNLPARNAYAVVTDGGVPAVLPTAGLLEQMGEIQRHAAIALKAHLEPNIPVHERLKQLWGDLPDDEEHRKAFGALLMTTAYAFLVHHEVGHLTRGHQRVWRGKVAPAAETEISTALGVTQGSLAGITDGDDGLQEAAYRPGAGDASHHNQVLEVDADAQAMFLTYGFLKDLAGSLLPNQVGELHDDVDGDPDAAAYTAVFRALLQNTEGLRLVLVAGACAGLLTLVADDAVEEIAALGRPSHPHIAERLVAAIVAEADVSSAGSQLMTDGLWLALVVISGKRLVEELNWLRAHADLESPDTYAQPRDADLLLSKYGLDELLDRLPEFRGHIGELAKRMDQVASELAKAALVERPNPYRWY